MIETQHAPESLAKTDRPSVLTESCDTMQQAVADPLMISLVVVVAHILCDRVPQRGLSEEDHSAQTLGLY